MRICFLCHEYPPGPHGGIGTFTQLLARALAQRGHAVVVAGVYPTRTLVREQDQGVVVIRIPHSRLRHLGFLHNALRLARQLRGLAAERPLDILEGQENAFALLRRTFPVCRVLRMHGGHHFFHAGLGARPRAARSWLERRSFAAADRFCAVSRHVADATRRLLDLGPVPIEILPNPVDTERFRPMPQVPVTPGLIAFVGTLCEKKGIRQLVQAMPEIRAAVPEACLVAFGRDTKDPASGSSYRKALEAALLPEVRGRVSFPDHMDNFQLPHELARAQVLVYPSHLEAHPVAWLEGLAMGKPVVASDTGPGPEVIEDGVSGLLCNPRDPHAIAESVIRVLRNGPLADRLGAAARQRALQEFSVDRLVGRNEDFYRRCVEAGRKAK